MTQKVEITIDGKTVELPVLEAKEGTNVVDVRGAHQRGNLHVRPRLFVDGKL